MTKFIIRRLLLGIIIVFCGAFVVYAVLRCLPTSYVESIARQRSALPGGKSYSQWLAELNNVYHLDTDIFSGFMYWLKDAIRGNFGDSWFYNVPVVSKFKDVIGYSIVINIITLFLEVIICIPLGILAARKQYSKTDYTVTVIALMGISLPSFFLATLLKYVFSIKLGWFDLYGLVGRFHDQLSFWGQIGDIAMHMVLPIVTLTMLSLGGLMRYTRTNMLEVLNADYIRTARAKGVKESRVINYHAFRNTMIPLVTIIGGTLPSLFSGALITETLFQIEGIGWTSYQAMIAGDIPFSMFYMTFSAILTLLGSLIADILYAVVDPRVRVA